MANEMKHVLLSGESTEELSANVGKWLKQLNDGKSIGQSETDRTITVYNVTPITFAEMTVSPLTPDRGTQKTFFQLLIFYS